MKFRICSDMWLASKKSGNPQCHLLFPWFAGDFSCSLGWMESSKLSSSKAGGDGCLSSQKSPEVSLKATQLILWKWSLGHSPFLTSLSLPLSLLPSLHDTQSLKHSPTELYHQSLFLLFILRYDLITFPVCLWTYTIVKESLVIFLCHPL